MLMRALRIGEALELDVEVLARDAARALGADEVAAADGFGFAGGVLDLRAARRRRSARSDELGRHAHLDQRMRLGHLQRFFDDLDALALQHIGKARVVLEQRVIELGDQRVVLPVPILKLRRDQAARLHLCVEPDAVEEFQRGRVVGAGARHLIEKIVVRHRLDQHDGNILLRQRQRQAQADRACAHHDDGIGLRHLNAATRSRFTSPMRVPSPARRPSRRRPSPCG